MSLVKSRLLNKKLSGTVLYRILVSDYESALPYHESTPDEISVLSMSMIFLLSGYESALP